jgi:Uma2 family endonuclease
MNAPDRNKVMTVDEFIPWAMAQPRGRFELVNGKVVAMSPERVLHTEAKGLAFVALRAAIQRARVECWCLTDGATVRIDDYTAYEPDALVYCGQKLSGDTIVVPSPVILVEVVSRSSLSTDAGSKFEGYFSLPSVRHYLIVDPERRCVIHHRRNPDGQIVSEALTDGRLLLDPPGLEVAISEMLPGD